MPIQYIDDLNTDGTVVGQTAAALVAFHGATPVAQASGSAQAAVVTTTPTTSAYGYTLAQATAVLTLLNEIRSVLVAKGLMKGSA